MFYIVDIRLCHRLMKMSNPKAGQEKKQHIDRIKNRFNYTLYRLSKFNGTLDALFNNCDEKTI